MGYVILLVSTALHFTLYCATRHGPFALAGVPLLFLWMYFLGRSLGDDAVARYARRISDEGLRP
jgi:hypothetical protein